MKGIRLLLTSGILLLASSTSFAQDNFTQDVTIVLTDINQLAVSAATVSMTINTAVAGSAPTDATDNSTTYAITTNGTTKKLTGVLDVAYASGLSLDLLLTAPTGGTATERTLTTTAQDLVTGVAQVAQSALTITYTASATVAASPNDPAGETNTVTVTLTDA